LIDSIAPAILCFASIKQKFGNLMYFVFKNRKENVIKILIERSTKIILQVLIMHLDWHLLKLASGLFVPFSDLFGVVDYLEFA